VPGYLAATIDFALANPATRDVMIEMIKAKAKEFV